MPRQKSKNYSHLDFCVTQQSLDDISKNQTEYFYKISFKKFPTRFKNILRIICDTVKRKLRLACLYILSLLQNAYLLFTLGIRCTFPFSDIVFTLGLIVCVLQRDVLFGSFSVLVRECRQGGRVHWLVVLTGALVAHWLIYFVDGGQQTAYCVYM